MPIDAATDQQKTIGLELVPRGFIAIGRKDIIEEGGTVQPKHKMTHLQRLLWSTVMVSLCNKRCTIQHGNGNQSEEANDLRLWGSHTVVCSKQVQCNPET